MKRTLLALNGKVEGMPRVLGSKTVGIARSILGAIVATTTAVAALVGLYVDVPELLTAMRHTVPARGEGRDKTTTRTTDVAVATLAQADIPAIEETGAQPAVVPKVEEMRELNVLVFDATGNSRLFSSMVQILRTAIPYGTIAAQFAWENKKWYDTTRVMWQREENKTYAECILDWLPGEQLSDVYIPYRTTHGARYFGIDASRDLIIFVGWDYGNIIEAYEKQETLICRVAG